LPKVEHAKFESYVMPNDDKSQNSVLLQFKYCLTVSFTFSFLITCTLAEVIAIFTHFTPPDLDLDL